MKKFIVLVVLFGLGLTNIVEDEVDIEEEDNRGDGDEDTDLAETPLSDAKSKPWNRRCNFPNGCCCIGARRRGYRYCYRRRTKTWGC